MDGSLPRETYLVCCINPATFEGEPNTLWIQPALDTKHTNNQGMDRLQEDIREQVPGFGSGTIAVHSEESAQTLVTIDARSGETQQESALKIMVAYAIAEWLNQQPEVYAVVPDFLVAVPSEQATPDQAPHRRAPRPYRRGATRRCD